MNFESRNLSLSILIMVTNFWTETDFYDSVVFDGDCKTSQVHESSDLELRNWTFCMVDIITFVRVQNSYFCYNKQ